MTLTQHFTGGNTTTSQALAYAGVWSERGILANPTDRVGVIRFW